MKIRAIAIASPQSNVIGAVELSTSAEGLRIVYLDCAQMGDGGVPVSLGRNLEMRVGWTQVTDARVLGSSVLIELALRPGVAHRLLLVRFTFGQDRTPHELRQRRVLLRAFAIGLAIMAVIIAILAGPRLSPHHGPLFGVFVGVFLAAVITVAGVISDRFVATGGHASSLVREIFVGELLATLPRLPRGPSLASTKPMGIRLPSFDGVIPRTTAAITITLSGALLAAIVMTKWVFWGNHEEVQQKARLSGPEVALESQFPVKREVSPSPAQVNRDTSVKAEPPKPAPAAVSQNTGPELRALGPCTCARADSPLWREPLPRLSPVVLTSRRVPHKNHEDVELDLAVVNNSDRPLGNINVLVEFFEAAQGSVTRLTSVESRTVFFEGPLLPGKAIKWHLQEQGTTFKVHPPTSNGLIIDDVIGPLGEGAAPASTFYELLTANNRPVRLHGAMMLAYLGDRRARPAIVEIGEALRDSEGAYIRRVLEATQDQMACQIAISSGSPRTIKACIYNQAGAPMDGANVNLRILDAVVSAKDPLGPAPQIIAERNFNLSTKLESKAGLLVEGTVDGSDLPPKFVSYEMVVGAQPR